MTGIIDGKKLRLPRIGVFRCQRNVEKLTWEDAVAGAKILSTKTITRKTNSCCVGCQDRRKSIRHLGFASR